MEMNVTMLNTLLNKTLVDLGVRYAKAGDTTAGWQSLKQHWTNLQATHHSRLGLTRRASSSGL